MRFRGSPGTLVQAASGQVWELTLPEDKEPDPAWRVATSVHSGPGIHMRIVGPRPSEAAHPVTPMEEAYLTLMSDVNIPSK